MRAKIGKAALWLFMVVLISSPAFVSTADAYYSASGPYYTYVYSPFGYSPYVPVPPELIPYRGAQALLTTLALLGVLPTSSTTLYSTTPYTSYTPYTTYSTPTPTPTYSYPTYTTSSTSIGIATALLLGGSTSTTTLLALGI
ncbi:MAG: hypothetical protein AB1611_10740 [bacterium]